jgi:5'-methylthioadenosine phosphorylase
MIKLGVIGGSGLYSIEGFENIREERIETPYGTPSDAYIIGELEGREIIFLPRHGCGHKLMPSELNHRANICGMKMLGVTHILSISAVGGLKEGTAPRDVVIVDQYFDRTKRPGTDHTFFGEGIVAHIAFADPTCPTLSQLAGDAAEQAIAASDASSRTVHHGGTYVNMEGPAFSTTAESNFYRSLGFDVIGMTNLAEAKLAREAEICYCTAAMVTDYDCWHQEHDSVTLELIIGNLNANVALAKDIIRQVALNLDSLSTSECQCRDAIACAIITSRDVMPPETIKKMQPIIGKYINV